MSLVPAEREALARIESQLRESDPHLAAMLRAFGQELSVPQPAVPERYPPAERQLRKLQVLAVAMAVLLALLWGITLSARSGQPPQQACGHGRAYPHACRARLGARQRGGSDGLSATPVIRWDVTGFQYQSVHMARK